MCTFKVSCTYAWYPKSQMFLIYSSNLAPPPLGATGGGGAKISSTTLDLFLFTPLLKRNPGADISNNSQIIYKKKHLFSQQYIMLIFELLITIFYFKFSINTWWQYRNIYRTINHLCNLKSFFISKLFCIKTNFSIDKNEKFLDVWKFLISF